MKLWEAFVDDFYNRVISTEILLLLDPRRFPEFTNKEFPRNVLSKVVTSLA